MAAGIDLGAPQLARPYHPAILAADADRQRAGPGDQFGDMLVDGPGEHHLDHLDHRRIGDPQPVDEGRLDTEALEHGVDLRAAAMDHDRIDADRLEQRDIVAELFRQGLLAHGVTAILDHDGGTGIAAQERQRLRQHPGLLGGRSGSR